MSFRGRSFTPRAHTRPPRGGRGGAPGVRGNFRFQGPESYVGRPASSSHDDFPVRERTSFEERDRVHRVRSSDEEFGARSHPREYTDISGPSSSYYGRRTSTIEYGHGGMKSVSDDNRVKTDSWSSDPFSEQRHYSTEKHRTADKSKVAPLEVEADQPSKVVAVEKAMEMAQRTREIISKLGGFKQVSQQSEGSVSFTGSSLQSETKLLEENASAATDASESSTLSKIRQNTSLVQYAFNLPVEAERMNQNQSSVPRPDVKYSWTDGEHKYGNAFETPIPDQSHDRTSYAVTRANASGSYEGNTAAYSQENTWNVSPKVTQEPAKTESCDPTIANILKSIGFNFEMSSMMQGKARKETSSVSHTESSDQASRVPPLYKEKADRYHAEQMRQYGTVTKPNIEESLHLHGTIDSSASKSTPHTLQHSLDDKPFADDMFKQSPVDFKLKFKASDSNADKKSGNLYEDFSDSDDDFSVTAKTDASIENKPATGITAQSLHSMSAFGHEGVPQQVTLTTNKTADDLDWEFSTEAFIRKLQQPRSQQRTVTVVPKSEPAGRNAAMSTVQGGHVDNMSESPNDNTKMTQSFVPLEELKTIKKTIIVSESSAKTESGAGKSESSSSTKNKDSSEKTFKQRNEGSSKYMEKASTDSSRKKNRRSEPDEDDDDDDTPTTGSKVAKLDTNSVGTGKERQKRIDSLLKELENLKRQQNILMRRKKREKDAHRDPFLMENSKLQEEICNQIDKLRKASQQTAENSESQQSQSRKDSDTETDGRSRDRSVRKSSRSVSPEGQNNRQYRSKSNVRSTDSTGDRQPRVKRIDVNYEYFDGGNHFCRCCNCFSVNIFEHCQHLISSAHHQNVDPFDKPWLKLAVKAPAKPAVPKGKVSSARIRGVEFLMSTQAFYCGLCDVFLGSCTCAETHCKSEEHNSKYAKYLDDNPYYERRLELEKSSSSAVTGKPLPASMQPSTSTLLRGRENESLAAVVEKAKEKVQEMVKKRSQEMADVDSIPLLRAHKSRVVPKSSTGVLSEDGISRQLQDDSSGTDVSSKKKSDSSATSLSDSSHHVSTNSEGKESTAESQKKEGPPTETIKTKKSLPFIGKLPFLKASRTAKQAAVEQSVTDDKSKIEIKLSAGAAVSTPVQSETTLSSDSGKTAMGERNSLDAFLSIGDPESGQCQAVPVLNVRPQTRSEFMIENQPDAKKTSAEKLASSNLLPTDEDAKRADSAVGMSGTDVVLKASVDVKAADTDAATPDLQHSGSVPLGDVSDVNQNDDRLLGITSTSVVQTRDTQILSFSEPHTADAAGTVVAAGTDVSHSIQDNENSEAMSLDEDDNTEDYEAENDSESKHVTRVARDEETAQILPQISDAWMQPAASVTNEVEEAAMTCDDFEILDECDAEILDECDAEDQEDC